jgi:glycosyltransferase involved in cell wall biosynthesis
MKSNPLISIVTPSFNQAPFIEEALDSVQCQSYTKHEHLVIDGMSTDGTIELLRNIEKRKRDQRLFWISERDSGQSEAVNKGFRRARGEIIGWLNSDDRYRPGCLQHVAQAFEDNPDIDVIYGDYALVDESGQVLKVRREIEFNSFILYYHRVLYIPTTTTFFRRRIFEDGNWLDESLQYAMDLEFFIRLAARGYRFRHLSELLAEFRIHPGSKTCSASDRQREEHRKIVYAIAPVISRIRHEYLKGPTLSLFRAMAGARRYSEKLLRGYYWQRTS